MGLARVEITQGTFVEERDSCTHAGRERPHPPPPQPPPVLTKHARYAEVFWTCTTHTLSTEREEVMGLLLGDVLVRSPF